MCGREDRFEEAQCPFKVGYKAFPRVLSLWRTRAAARKLLFGKWSAKPNEREKARIWGETVKNHWIGLFCKGLEATKVLRDNVWSDSESKKLKSHMNLQKK